MDLVHKDVIGKRSETVVLGSFVSLASPAPADDGTEVLIPPHRQPVSLGT